MAGLGRELRSRTRRGFGLDQFAPFLPRTKLMPPLLATVADDDPSVTACFSVHAHADPGVMPRVLELFAKRGLVPSAWHSIGLWNRSGRADDRHSNARARARSDGLHSRLSAADRLCRGRTDLGEARRNRLIGALGCHVVPRPYPFLQQLRPGPRSAALCRQDRVGLLRRDNAAALRRFPDVFAVTDDRVSL